MNDIEASQNSVVTRLPVPSETRRVTCATSTVVCMRVIRFYEVQNGVRRSVSAYARHVAIRRCYEMRI